MMNTIQVPHKVSKHTFANKPYQRKWYQFMLDIAWPELIIIGIVAVVAIGPKDLPKVMNQLGRWTGKARMIAQDMQRSMDQLNFEAEAAERVKTQSAAQAEAAPAAQMHSNHVAAAQAKHHHAPVHDAAAATPAPVENPNDHLGST